MFNDVVSAMKPKNFFFCRTIPPWT